MRTLSRSVTLLSAAALAAAGIAATAGSASAALTTRCDGEASSVTVPGDLVVAKGKSCVLTDVTIEGEVRVQAGADLLITDSSVDGRVLVRGDGYFDASTSEIAGNVVSNGGYGVYLDESAVDGNYNGRAAEGASPFLYSYDSSITGRVNVAQGLVHLSGNTIGGNVTSENSEFTDILDSTVAGNLTVTGATEGTTFCAGELDGDATLTGNAGVQLGSGGQKITCEGATYFGGDVTASDNTDGVDVTDTIIRGDLTGEGNDPAPTGSENRVRGELGGQFVDLQPAAQQRALMTQSAPADNAEELDTQREERRAEAEKAAEQAGPANLR
ncbi:hypothetical protein [Brachybacterium atlanticum]|uniref:hypothetical protein n=1 Tax=Brachybacterium atlanticum TaxID=2911888 RepID=UPI0021DF4C28|nr:hypothetical protein [Brachybacterium atlanticum]